MPRSYGVTNTAPWASAPTVGPAGDSYYNTASKQLFLSDGTQWNAIGGSSGGGVNAYTQTLVAPTAAGSPYAINHNLNFATPLVQIYDAVTGSVVLAQVTTTSVNQITVTFGQNSPNNVIVVVSTGGGPPGPTGPSAANTFNLVYLQTITAPTVASSPYTVTHNLNSTYILVQTWDSVTGQLVQTQVRVVDANHITISTAQNMPNNLNVVVTAGPASPAPIVPADWATKSYVDARTPNLPAPVVSGSGVQSFTDTLGDVWVAANGVYSGAWKRARDVLHSRISRIGAWNTSTTAVQFSYDTINYDVYGMYSAGGWITPIAGIYQYTAAICFGAQATGAFCEVGLRIGASSIAVNSVGAASSGSGGLTGFSSCTTSQAIAAAQALTASQRAPAAIAGQAGSNYCYSTLDYLGTG